MSPPPAGIGGVGSGISVTSAEVDQDHGCDGACILNGAACHLGRVDDAGFQHVDVAIGNYIVACGIFAFDVQAANLLDHNGPSRPALPAIMRIGSSSARRRILIAGRSIAFQVHLVQGRNGVDQRNTATGDNALFHSGAGGAQRILNAMLLFLELGLGGCANTDDGNAAGQLGQTLLQLLTIIVAGAGLRLGTDLIDATFDVVGGRSRRRWWWRPWC
jgi:hypothetical protein